MAITKHPCAKGLTLECFERYPQFARRAFATKLMHTLFPAAITRRLPKGLRPGIIAFPPGWDPNIPLTPQLEPRPPPGITVPPGGAIPPLYNTPFQPGPPHIVSPTKPGVVVDATITAQNDGRQGCAHWTWAGAHDATDGTFLLFPENETDCAIQGAMDPPDYIVFRSFFDFDLSGIPEGASITWAKLTLKSYGAETCIAIIQEGTQSDTLDLPDYDAFTGALFDSLTWAAGSNEFTLNTAGKTYIRSKFTGTAKLCMREYNHDYLNAEPGVGESFQAGCYWSGAAAANRPKLEIRYVS